jgi:hypothetical protein
MPKVLDPQRLKAMESARSAAMRADIDFTKLEAALGDRYKITIDQRNDIEFAFAFACEGRARVSPHRRKIGRPNQNQEWEVLIQCLADLYSSITRKRATINSRNEKKPASSSSLEFGSFWTFTKTLFEQIPKDIIRPTDTALVPLIKRSLSPHAGRNRVKLEKKQTRGTLDQLRRKKLTYRNARKSPPTH